jgi:hypothetical protein
MNERKYKLSEAILKGCELTGQGFGTFLDNKGRTCALGAAHHAAFGELPDGKSNVSLNNMYPELSEKITEESPLFFHLSPKIQSIVRQFKSIHLQWAIEESNDLDKKTREEIAIMLEKVGY